MSKPTAPETSVSDRKLDEAVKESFPASDPPAHSGVTGVRGQPDRSPVPDKIDRPLSHQRDDDARPTGYPTSDRHAVETAHGWENEVGTEAEKP